MIITEINGIVCKIGQNAKDNWELLKCSKNTNYFFHLSSFPSCFVVLECDDTPYIETIYGCAKMCKSKTKYKNVPDIYVDYCMCDNVRKGKEIGEIVYISNKRVLRIKV